MTEIPEYILKRNIFRFVTTVEKFKMLSIFCPVFLLLLLLQRKRGSLFWAESSVTSRFVLLVRKSRVEAEGLSPLHGALSRCNGKVKPPTNKKHGTSSKQPSQPEAHIYLPEAIVHLELRTLFLSIYLFIFCCCCGSCNT